MIADNQIPAVIIQTLHALDIPLSILSQAHPSGIAGKPIFSNPIKNTVDYPEQRRPGKKDFRNGEHVQDRYPEYNIYKQKQSRDRSHNN
jgi:hypothetical protein